MLKDHIRVGDRIKCIDKDDMLEQFTNLLQQGIRCEFVYKQKEDDCLWLVVEEIKGGCENGYDI